MAKAKKSGPVYGPKEFAPVADGFGVATIRESEASGVFGYRKDPAPKCRGYVITKVNGTEHECWAHVQGRNSAVAITAMLNKAHNDVAREVKKALNMLWRLNEISDHQAYSEKMDADFIIEGL